jgi:lipopolysaccharide biosynthesis glycosyltransferase
MVVTKAIVTLCIGFDEIAKFSHPTFKLYANKINADFIVMKDRICKNIYFCKFYVRELLEKYDRILFIDTDCLVRSNCPDLFEIVPEDCFGLYNELDDLDKSNIDNHLGTNYWMKQCIALYNFDIRWNIELTRSKDEWSPYYNTGVMLFGKQHKDLFILPDKFVKMHDHTEQSYLNCRIIETDTKVFELSHKFNRLTKMKDIKEDIWDSYIIHYANYDGDTNITENRFKEMKSDYENFIVNDQSR